MPTYEYQCDGCGYSFEKFQKMNDEPLKECPKCGANVHRLIGTGGGIIFKGNGFYQTDYKKKPEPKKGDSCPEPKGDGCKGCSLNKDQK
ncbi:MAG: zinc ribbon domain-containing protein [Candidatus Omnitrophica bacterium]|nr:zinc ribbon domain-containing protein [Candidatus Omnitrophota bacterium]